MSNEQRIKILEEKREKINNVSCSFCTAKWLQTTLMLQNGYNHSCHHPAPHKIPLKEIEADPAALHNSQYKKEQRLKMLTGERPSECSYCWKIEDLGKDYFSDRHYKTADTWAWDRFEEIAESDPGENVYPSYLEVSFSNACNFACAYCSPEISSKWMEDVKQHGPYPTKHGAHNLDYLEKSGKMPYLNRDHNPYAEVNVKVDVYTSLESTGNQAEYARDGLNYFKWIGNVERILKETKSTVAIMTTINILSLTTFLDFIMTVMDLRKIYNTSFETNRVPLSINIMHWPPHLQCTLLDKDYRISTANTIEAVCKNWLKYYTKEKYARIYLEEFDQIQRFCDYLRTTEPATEHRADFVRYIYAYDERRNKDFVETFPQYAHLLEEWNGEKT
jgi:hypothetical protein